MRNTTHTMIALAFALGYATFGSYAQVLYPDETRESFVPNSLDQFGADISISGDRMLIAAPAHWTSHPGNVYLVDIETGDLIHQFDQYAREIAFNEDYIVLAYGEFTPNPGLALIYDAESFELLRQIEIGDGSSSTNNISIAINGDRLFFGSPESDQYEYKGGQVLVFNVTSGELERELFPNEFSPLSYFGSRVSVDGDQVAVINRGPTDETQTGSRLYIFNANTGQVEYEHTLDVNPGFISNYLSVYLKNDILLYSTQHSGFPLYESDVRVVDLSEPNPFLNERIINYPERSYETIFFGKQLRLFGNHITASSLIKLGPYDYFDRVHLFNLDTLEHTATIHGDQGSPAHSLFLPNKMVDETLFVGRVNNGIEGPIGDGFISMYTITDCPLDFDYNRSLTIADLLIFIDERPDWNDDGAFNFFDVSLYIEQYLEGCS